MLRTHRSDCGQPGFVVHFAYQKSNEPARMPDDQPRIDRVTTRHGDRGTTSLADGKRYAKADPRMELVGALDELNCALGIAAVNLDGEWLAYLREIQSRIFDAGAAVATGQPQPYWVRETERLSERTNRLNEFLEPLAEFVLPGSNEANARLHVARATARHCERVFWGVNDATLIEAGIGAYLNRLSDFLFVAARSVCETEVVWEPLKE